MGVALAVAALAAPSAGLVVARGQPGPGGQVFGGGEPGHVDPDLASSDPDGTVVTWDWDFGDCATGSGEVVTYTYAGAGAFSVTLTVTDDGATDADTQQVTVGPNQLPVADFTAACSGFFFIFWCNFDGGASSDPDGT